jgi:glycolate oxidase
MNAELKFINEQLERIFEKKDIISNPIHLIAYKTDASMIKGQALFTVFPENIDQIRRLILFAGRQNLKLVPRGGGTGLVGGAVPNNSVVVDLSKMVKISQFSEDEKTIFVEPGVILEKLNCFLKDYKLMFPVIPSSHKVCTIGGMIATNAVGLRAVKYGRTSSNVLELHLLDGKGKVHILKDRSAIGSEGILGFIVGAKLALEKIPQKKSLSFYEFSELDLLVDKVTDLKKTKGVSAIEYIDKKSSLMIGLEENYHLLVEFENELGDYSDAQKMNEIWSLREGLRTIYGNEGYLTIEDPVLPLSKMKEFLLWCEERDIPCYSHIGVGIVHNQFRQDQRDLIDEMLKYAISLGGKVSGEHGIGILKKKYLSNEIKYNIEKLKKTYDPKNILNPNKIIDFKSQYWSDRL